MYRRSFVIKTYVDFINIVSDSFPRFYTACRISIELVILKGMHWERAGRVGRENKGDTAHFYVSIAIENIILGESFPSPCLDSGFRVATGPARAGHFRVAT